MDILAAIILSVVEGITEFLPISSTGHLVLAARLLNIPQTDFVKSFEVIIQLGAIAAIVFLYGRTLLVNRDVLKRVALAFLPTALLGFTLYKVIKDMLIGNVEVTLAALFLGGIALIILELMYKEQKHHVEKIEDLPLKNVFFIGLIQSLSMIPGVSRAAATIIGGLFLGYKRKAAVEFSFLLAIPTMLAATGLDLLKSNFAFSSEEYLVLAVGLVGSFVVALASVKFLLRFIENHTFIPFGMYRIVLAIIYFLIVVK